MKVDTYDGMQYISYQSPSITYHAEPVVERILHFMHWLPIAHANILHRHAHFGIGKHYYWII